MQFLSRMKDSSVLLQKKLVQEQPDGDQTTLLLYKVCSLNAF